MFNICFALLLQDAPCPISGGDRDHSGQYRKVPGHVMHKSSGGTYSKPDARVKLIPAEDITYVRRGKPFSKTIGSSKLQKNHCRRSVTPPPSSRKVSLARSAPLNHKPTRPAPSVAPSLSPKRFETAENGQIVSLNRPSPICKAVQRDAIPPAVLLKQAAVNPKSPSSVHVLPAHSSKVPEAHSSKVPLRTKAEPSSKSVVNTLDNKKLCSTSHQATQVQRDQDHTVQKEPTVKPSLLSPTSVLSTRTTEVGPDTRSSPSPGFDGKCKLASLQPETSIPQAKSPQSTTPVPCDELSNDFEAVPSSKNCSRNETLPNQEASISCNMSSEIAGRKVCQNVHPASITQGAPVLLHTKLYKKPNHPETCWKGKFEVIGELTHTCDGIEAHFPREIFIKVYEATKQMPEILKLEALPLSCVLPKIFKMEPPDGQDIGLCFISSLQRSNRNFDHLLECTSSHIGLRTNIGTTELLIYSSKLLTKDDQTKDGKFYFWGVFRKNLRKKQHRDSNHRNNLNSRNASLSKRDSRIPEDIGMNLDMTEGIDKEGDKQTEGVKCKSGTKLELTGDKETNRINKCLAMRKTADSNAAVCNAAPAVSFFTGSCSPDSTDSPCKSSTRAPASGDLVLDSPPGFLDIPPGFTRAHYRIRAGETAQSYIDSSSSLVLDTPGYALDIPPGFTSAHRGSHTNATITSPGSENGVSTPFPEKKPQIKFSLNVPRPVQTDARPGFAELLKVKKEPGLPAPYKATEKLTPIGKANEIKFKHDEANVELQESSEEGEFRKTKRMSDLLGFSSPSSSNNTSPSSSIPRKCPEVSVSAAPSASKFQEKAPPEKQSHGWKRGQPEPSGPSAAEPEATKRLKVNGRMALNRCIGHRGL